MSVNMLLDNLKSICLTTNGFYCFNSKQFVKEPFEQVEEVRFVVNNYPPILVPNILQISQNYRDYLQLLGNNVSFDQTFLDDFQSYKLIYGITDQMIAKISSFNMQPHFQHLLSYSHQLVQDNFSGMVNGNYFVVNVLDTEFDLYLFKEGRCCLANRYSFKSLNDILYYIVNVLYQFEMKNEDAHLFLLQANKEIFKFFDEYYKTFSLI